MTAAATKKSGTLKIGSSIQTKQGTGIITKIGDVHYSTESRGVGWVMLTLDLLGTVGYAPARDDELAIE